MQELARDLSLSSRLRSGWNDEIFGGAGRDVEGLGRGFFGKFARELMGDEDRIAEETGVVGFPVEAFDADEESAAAVALAGLSRVEFAVLDDGETLWSVVALCKVREEIDSACGDRFAVEGDGSGDVKSLRTAATPGEYRRGNSEKKQTEILGKARHVRGFSR